MKAFIIARGAFGADTPFIERVTLERHHSPRVSSLTVSIVDGARVLAERSATFHGLRCPLSIADVEHALSECRADIEVFHKRDTYYTPALMAPDPVGVVSLAQALVR